MIALALLSLPVTACRSDTVDLAYALEAGSIFRYEIDARAEASWDIGGEGDGSYEVSFEVTETVESADEDGAIVAVVMTPTRVEEEGLPSPGPENRSFTLQLSSDGEVLQVFEVDGVPAEALEPDELAFIGTYRPPLPQDQVTLLDTWSASREMDTGSVFQQVATEGRLRGLAVSERGDVAEVGFEGDGPLVWTTTLPQGAAELTGLARTSSDVVFNIADGHLDTANSSTRGDFQVRVLPGQGQAPIVGTLQLDLFLDLKRL
jgi:hypothetical protein